VDLPWDPASVAGVDIRVERSADAAAVRRVHVQAFGNRGDAVGDLLDGLRRQVRPENGLSLVSVDGDDPVGHVLFSRGLLDAPQRLVEIQVLSPVAVVPERQGEGIGSALIRRGLDVMAERGVPVVFLEGDPRYYSRLGFESGGAFGFRKPSLRIPDFAFQAIRLPAYKPWMTGTLVYTQAFWDHDAVGLRNSQ
jgi:putative acetyltransferase